MVSALITLPFDRVHGIMRRTVSMDASFQSRISFVYLDGVAHSSRMWALGLRPGLLPSLAFNVKDGRRLPFVGDALTEVSITRFCNDFLAGRLPDAPLADSVTPQTSQPAFDELVRSPPQCVCICECV